MPPKRKLPQPIDRPLSRAYLRGFTGWSTAYPPGNSEPASTRIMDNVMVERNGGLRVRHGLRYLSYATTPDNPATPTVPGKAITEQIVGSMEMFYTADGSRALLFAVRETDQTVGFRAVLLSGVYSAVYRLNDNAIGFRIPQGVAPDIDKVLRFSAATTYVKYLQINNRILALSDAGEPARLFSVGAHKVAKVLNTISVPAWSTTDKATVLHPDAAWINGRNPTHIANEVYNPSFEAGFTNWTASSRTGWAIRYVDGSSLAHWEAHDVVDDLAAVNPAKYLEIQSLPARTNIVHSPLKNAAVTGTPGWTPHSVWPAMISTLSSYMKVSTTSGGRYYASTHKLAANIKPGLKYKVAADVDTSSTKTPELLVDFYTVDGAQVEVTLRVPIANQVGRWVSGVITAPDGAVTMRISFGGEAATLNESLLVKNVVACLSTEATTIFDGSNGANYFWAGTTPGSSDGVPNASPSVYHPPYPIEVASNVVPALPGYSMRAAAMMAASVAGPTNCSIALVLTTKDGGASVTQAGSFTVNTVMTRKFVDIPSVPANYVKGVLSLRIDQAARGQRFLIDDTLVVNNVAALPAYFDGSTLDTSTLNYRWADVLKPHGSRSIKATLAAALPALAPETPTANTLVKTGGATANPYKTAVFYAFENEVGESLPSQMTEIRTQRPWSNWRWETANATGEPSGVETATADLCADQLVVKLPQAVYDQAIADGALSWKVYAMTWSDQDPVPVIAELAGERPLRATTDITTSDALPYADGGWIALTPSRAVTLESAVIPTANNRTNYSIAPRHRNGLVAGERMILVGNPTDLATIQWSSNLPAESTNFSPSKGGGVKTLTSGNLNTPSDVALWQNPQSVDTITILCTGDDGESVCYYMAPASITQGQSGAAQVMGFEQVTNTPGTTGAYASQVMNNALYRPLDFGVMKSTANNYNLAHKMVSDPIANSWVDLRQKHRIVAAQLENRLYLLVHNPLGALLEDGCRGNEIWVYDVSSENGSWSRLTIQAASLKTFTVGTRTRMGIVTPKGAFYLDPLYRMDDYVDNDGYVRQRPIPWYFETNTQGANRAHDAWCHLQQIVLTAGNFKGTMQYGVRGQTVNGKMLDISKQFRDDEPVDDEHQVWDVDDALLIRRDMREWFFYAGSVEGRYSSGQVSAVQYRYTPVSVNVGYEYGSIETFEYGANVDSGPNTYSENGIPVPVTDFSRP